MGRAALPCLDKSRHTEDIPPSLFHLDTQGVACS
jgi:hypothetical protein